MDDPIKVEVTEDELIIHLPLDKNPKPSKKSGKTLIVANTHGYHQTPAKFGDKEITINAFAFVRA